MRTDLVWRASGLSYPTAVIATKGWYLDEDGFIRNCRQEVGKLLLSHLPATNKTALDFGCGIGGNLISIAPELTSGSGIDINPRFARIATHLAHRRGFTQLKFLGYDGVTLPDLGKYGLIYSLNVFERIPKDRVRGYLQWMGRSLSPGGTMVIFFLSLRAVQTGFADRLGEGAYVFWTAEEAMEVMRSAGVSPEDPIEWEDKAYIVVGRSPTS